MDLYLDKMSFVENPCAGILLFQSLKLANFIEKTWFSGKFCSIFSQSGGWNFGQLPNKLVHTLNKFSKVCQMFQARLQEPIEENLGHGYGLAKSLLLKPWFSLVKWWRSEQAW